jgi:hypothetical protein
MSGTRVKRQTTHFGRMMIASSEILELPLLAIHTMMMLYYVLLVLVLNLCLKLHGCVAFLTYIPLSPGLFGITDALTRQGQRRPYVFATPSADQQHPDEWSSKAARLREEIRTLEAAAATTRRSLDASATIGTSSPVVEYTDIADSIWTLSYRFTENPDSDSSEPASTGRRFSGKMKVKLRSDGYTDLLLQESVGSTESSCRIVKAWGWDIELSKENKNSDDEEYVLFSIDVELPPSKDGAVVQNSFQQRFYFQARLKKDSRTAALSITDGTVTVKRDMLQKTNQWAFLSPAGILAQFRYVGGFIAKPGTE